MSFKTATVQVRIPQHDGSCSELDVRVSYQPNDLIGCLGPQVREAVARHSAELANALDTNGPFAMYVRPKTLLSSSGNTIDMDRVLMETWRICSYVNTNVCHAKSTISKTRPQWCMRRIASNYATDIRRSVARCTTTG
jgi:hypothetical protein